MAPKKVRIGIVEDEAIVSIYLQDQLELLGYEVVSLSASGEQALAQLPDQDPDMVLMDINLAGALDGIETALSLREDFKIPVIFLTAFSDSEMLKRAKRAAPFGYLLKPVRQRELASTLEMALHRSLLEQRLRQSQELLVTILRSVADSVIVSDLSGRVTFMNPAAEQLTKWLKEEALGKEAKQLLDIIDAQAEDLVQKPDLQLQSTVLRDRAGTLIPIEEHSTELTDHDGMPLGKVSVIRDITERREWERALALKNVLLEAMAGALTSFLKCGDVKESLAKLLEVIGQTGSRQSFIVCKINHDYEVLAYAPAPPNPSQVEEVIQWLSLELSWAARDQNFCNYGFVQENELFGALHVSFPNSTNAIFESLKRLSQTAAILCGSYRRRQRQEALEEELRQAHRLEAVGRLAGGIAHDFNNLLTVVLGQASLLKDIDLPEEVRQGIDDIETSAQRAAVLTRQLLTFSRKQAVQPRRIDPNELIRGLQPFIAPLLGIHVKALLELCSDRPILADPLPLEQALLNLLANARDAMPEGGTVIIRTENFQCERGNSKLRISVIDQGDGISPENLAHVFEPFFTTKEVGKGTGLGLASVYGTMKQAGGSAKVELRPEGGTIFHLEFPAQEDVAMVAFTEQVDQAERRSGAGETILVVEDQDSIRTLMTRVLQRQGYTIIAFSSALEALEYSEHFDLLVTDVVMPGMSGIELAKRMRGTSLAKKTLIISGFHQESLPEENFLGKPFTAEQLTHAVRRALAT